MWRVAWRWRRLLGAVLAILITLSLTAALSTAPFRTEVRVLVQPRLPPDDILLSSRYPQDLLRIWYVQRVLTDLGDYVESRAFGSMALSHYQAHWPGEPPSAADIAGSLESRTVHRTLRISVTARTSQATAAIARATAAALTADGAQFAADEAGQTQIEVTVITDGLPPRRLVSRLRLLIALAPPLAMVLGLLLGLRVAASQRRSLDTADEVESALGAPILGAIPAITRPERRASAPLDLLAPARYHPVAGGKR